MIESKDVMHEPSLPVDDQSGAGEIAHPTPKIQRVLVIEDDRRSAVLMKSILDGLARVVVVAGTAMAALDALGESEFDLITLDIGLPDMSGIELIPNIRAMTNAPTIMVTANSQMLSLVEALELGADDYLVKPVRPAELRSRIRAITRRTRPRAHELSEYVDQHVRIDFARATVTNASSSTVLSATERHLLHELVSTDAGC